MKKFLFQVVLGSALFGFASVDGMSPFDVSHLAGGDTVRDIFYTVDFPPGAQAALEKLRLSEDDCGVCCCFFFKRDKRKALIDELLALDKYRGSASLFAGVRKTGPLELMWSLAQQGNAPAIVYFSGIVGHSFPTGEMVLQSKKQKVRALLDVEFSSGCPCLLSALSDEIESLGLFAEPEFLGFLGDVITGRRAQQMPRYSRYSPEKIAEEQERIKALRERLYEEFKRKTKKTRPYSNSPRVPILDSMPELVKVFADAGVKDACFSHGMRILTKENSCRRAVHYLMRSRGETFTEEPSGTTLEGEIKFVAHGEFLSFPEKLYTFHQYNESLPQSSSSIERYLEVSISEDILSLERVGRSVRSAFAKDLNWALDFARRANLRPSVSRLIKAGVLPGFNGSILDQFQHVLHDFGASFLEEPVLSLLEIKEDKLEPCSIDLLIAMTKIDGFPCPLLLDRLPRAIVISLPNEHLFPRLDKIMPLSPPRRDSMFRTGIGLVSHGNFTRFANALFEKHEVINAYLNNWPLLLNLREDDSKLCGQEMIHAGFLAGYLLIPEEPSCADHSAETIQPFETTFGDFTTYLMQGVALGECMSTARALCQARLDRGSPFREMEPIRKLLPRVSQVEEDLEKAYRKKYSEWLVWIREAKKGSYLSGDNYLDDVTEPRQDPINWLSVAKKACSGVPWEMSDPIKEFLHRKF